MTENQDIPGVALRGLEKSFRTPHAARRTVEAVRGVDISIRAGEIVALLGPNGAGKSTTIDMLLGLAEPDLHDTAAGVAAALHLSEGTVRNYLSAAIQKLGARNRSEATAHAVEKGWL